jgi:hypothetical protein
MSDAEKTEIIKKAKIKVTGDPRILKLKKKKNLIFL